MPLESAPTALLAHGEGRGYVWSPRNHEGEHPDVLAIAEGSQTGRLHWLHGAVVRSAQRTFRKPFRQQERLKAVRNRTPGEEKGSHLKDQL